MRKLTLSLYRTVWFGLCKCKNAAWQRTSKKALLWFEAANRTRNDKWKIKEDDIDQCLLLDNRNTDSYLFLIKNTTSTTFSSSHLSTENHRNHTEMHISDFLQISNIFSKSLHAKKKKM